MRNHRLASPWAEPQDVVFASKTGTSPDQRKGHDVVLVSRQLGHANAAIALKVYARWFDAARHAEAAWQRLSEDLREVLRRREMPGKQLGFDV